MQDSERRHIQHSRRPDISEVIRSLRAAGSADVAERIVAITGVNPSEIVEAPDASEAGCDAVPKRSSSSKSSSVANANATAQDQKKYLRGRYRFAYIYVNSTKASLDEQSLMLTAFLKEAKVLKKTCSKTANILETYELLPITLPRNIVCLSLRVNMHELKNSVLMPLIEKSKALRVYFRKPRQDTQHLAEQAAKTQMRSTPTAVVGKRK